MRPRRVSEADTDILHGYVAAGYIHDNPCCLRGRGNTLDLITTCEGAADNQLTRPTSYQLADGSTAIHAEHVPGGVLPQCGPAGRRRWRWYDAGAHQWHIGARRAAVGNLVPGRQLGQDTAQCTRAACAAGMLTRRCRYGAERR